MKNTTSSYQPTFSCKSKIVMHNLFRTSVFVASCGILSVLGLSDIAHAQQTTSGYDLVTPTDPSTPPAPNLSVVPGNGRVTLYWDDVAEKFVDPVLTQRNIPQNRQRNFEGYKIYKSTDPQFLDALTVTDNQGNVQGYRPIAQFDRANGIREYHPASINGMRYWVGTDNGIQRIFVDEDVLNGRNYYYAVVAYTHGDAIADFPVPIIDASTGEPYDFPPATNTIYTHSPRESLLDMRVDVSENQFQFGRNVVRVMPNAGAAGYQEAIDPVVERISGSAGGTISVRVIDPLKAKANTRYAITFEDTTIAGATALDPDLVVTKNFSLTNIETGELVFDRDERFRTEQLLIKDGLLLEITNSGDTVRVNNELSRWNSQTSRQIHQFQFGVSTRYSKLADYRVEFFDEPVSRSTDYVLRVGALNLTLPAEDVNFKVFNTTDGTEIPFAFFVNPSIPRDLRDVVFLNENRGVTVGGAGQIRLTSNGGESWNNIDSPTTKRLNAVFFINETTGWAVGEDGIILKTTDSGTNWVDLELNTSLDFNDVYFLNEDTGFAVGESGWIMRTTDGGFTWSQVNSNSNRILRSVEFVNEFVGFIVGNTSEVLRTTDGGLTWNRDGISFEGGSSGDLFRNLTSIDFIDQNTGWMVGFLGVIWRTDNAGLTWVRQRPPQNVQLSDVAFANATNGFVVGANGTIFATVDGGNTWTAQTSGTITPLNGISVTSSSTAYVIGDGPTILNTANSGQNWSTITTEKRFRAFIDANGLPRSDEIYFIEDFGTETDVTTWKVAMLPNTRLGTLDPGAGDDLELVTIKPFTRADEYRFTIADANLPSVESVLEESILENIKVVPNPYVVTHIGEPNSYGSGAGVRQLHFTHLPAQCTVRIFNVSGQLVQTIYVDNNVGVNRYIWDMRNSNGHEIPYGVYIYHVEAPGVGEKTGKFAVIK